MADKKGLSIKHVITIGVLAFILGALIMFLLNTFAFNKNKTVVSMKGYKITKIDLYEKMKKDYGLTYALEDIDNRILEDKYPLTDEEMNEIEEDAKAYIESYAAYGYKEEDFLKMYGFSSMDDFKKQLITDKRQDKFFNDCVVKLLGEDTLKEYYNSQDMYGDINSKHILVEVSATVSEEQAKSLANTIIAELNSGSSWEEVVEKYKGQIIVEDLGYQGIDNNFEQSFMDALIAMEDNSYSKEPVKTSYGYHVIYRLDSLDTPTYEEARPKIINILSSSIDQNEYYKMFADLEKEYGLKFYDKDLQDSYDEVVKEL